MVRNLPMIRGSLQWGLSLLILFGVAITMPIIIIVSEFLMGLLIAWMLLYAVYYFLGWWGIGVIASFAMFTIYLKVTSKTN
jgi:hypothetical protein